MTKQARIATHINNLEKIFPTFRGEESWARLLRLERKAHKFAEDRCTVQMTEDEVERRRDEIEDALEVLLCYRAARIPVFVNSDPRGYALKIRDSYVLEHNLDIHRDWGGYGILAPEFD